MVEAFAISDAGLVRKSNEDSYICDEQLQLYIVADGMGGHSAGEVASRLAVEAIEAFISRSSEDGDFSWPYGVDPLMSLGGTACAPPSSSPTGAFTARLKAATTTRAWARR